MAAKKSASLDFTRQYLKNKPEASFAEIRDAAAEKDLKIYPIVFGRAKALEGLVEVAPYGSKKKAREEAERAKNAALKPETSTSTSVATEERGSLEGIDAMLRGVRENLDERERYRTALIKISEILDSVL